MKEIFSLGYFFLHLLQFVFCSEYSAKTANFIPQSISSFPITVCPEASQNFSYYNAI